MKTKITIGFIASLFLCVFSMQVHAAVQCPSNATPELQATDPACWTSASSGYWQNCVWQIAGAVCDNVTPSGYWAGSVFVANSCSDCPSAKYYTCHGNNYTNTCGGTWCDNAGPLPGNYSQWVDSTSYTCHYTTVKSWSACSATTGIRYATSVNQLTKSGTGCTSDVSTQSCGICGTAQGVGTDTAPTTGLCAFGSATTPKLVGDTWTWTCTGGSSTTTDDDASCTAPRSVDGVCNTTAMTPYNWYDTAFRATLCSSGTPTINANTSFPACGATVTWGCTGIGSGKSTAANACSATRELNPACACGSADGSTSLNKPSSNLCGAGDASDVTGSNGTWSWACGTSYTFNGNATLTCRDQRSCTAECVSIDLDVPTQLYVSDDENTVDAKITINNCSAASNVSCTINGNTVAFSGDPCKSDPVSLPFAGSSMTVNATCTMNVTCGGGSGGTEKTLTKTSTVYGMCAERSCTGQGICQAVPKAAVSPSACHSTCSTDADCSRGRMIETRP